MVGPTRLPRPGPPPTGGCAVTPRPLAEIDAALARLDAQLLPLGDFETAEAEAPGLLDRLADDDEQLHKAT